MKKRVLVPTMGALHQGHGALIKKASTLGDPIVSIFVNPTQFGPTEDFEKYPRSAERDLDYALKCGAKEVLFPKVSEIYPSGPVATEDSGFLGSILEGAHRPGFFNGVVTVVKKLFEIAFKYSLVYWFGFCLFCINAKQKLCFKFLFNVSFHSTPLLVDDTLLFE